MGHLRKSKDVFHRQNKLVRSATSLETLLPESTLEFAIMGSPNVGKSTLINRLTSTKLARVSSYPNRTKALNFYSINSGKLFLVDFPGYQPFAQTSSEQQDQEESHVEDQEFLYHYLSTRKHIKVMVLLNSQLGLQITDFDLITYLEENKIKHQVVVAKADLVSQSLFDEQVEKVKELIRSHEHADQEVLAFSSSDKNTVDRIRAKLVEYGGFGHVKERLVKKQKQKPPSIDFDTFREEYLKLQEEQEQEEREREQEESQEEQQDYTKPREKTSKKNRKK